MKHDLYKKIRNLKDTKSEIKNLVVDRQNDVATIFIYDVIDPWWGISASAILETTMRLIQEGATSILVRINSPGGDVFEGLAIYNHLKTLSIPVDTQIDGGAHSIASIIALAGKTIKAMPASLMMIHEPWVWTAGTAANLREMADILDKHRDILAGIYMQKTGKSYEDIVTLLVAETWMTADEAKEHGFVDEILAPTTADDDAPSDLSARAQNIMAALYPEKSKLEPVNSNDMVNARAKALAKLKLASL